MGQRTHITPDMLRVALSELMLASAPYVRSFGKGRSATQQRLLETLNMARELARQPIQVENLPLDPDVLLQAYIAAGGNWRDLVAAVNRNALDATIQRYQQTKGAHDEQKQTS